MSVGDKLAIQQEVARYSYAFDSGDAEGWADVFTEDGLWEFYAAGATEPTTRLDGRDALREFAAQRRRDRPEGMTSYHHQSGIIFDEMTSDSARVRAMLVLTVQTAGEPPRLFMTGIYRDHWVKTPQGWRLKYRVLRP